MRSNYLVAPLAGNVPTNRSCVATHQVRPYMARQIKLGAVQHIAYGAVIEGVRVKVGHRRGNLVHFMPAGVQKGGDRWTPGPVVRNVSLIYSADGRQGQGPTRDGAEPIREWTS